MHHKNSIVTPETEIAVKVVEVPFRDLEEKGVIIVHCHFTGGGAIRIWRSTFLVDRFGNHKSKLLHVENVAMAPQWTLVAENKEYIFTLYFEGLPKSCKMFDLHEIIPQPGGFFIPAIGRNNVDVYNVEIF